MKKQEIIVRGPERVRVIAEFADHLLVPAGAERYIEISVRRRKDEQLVVWSPEFGGSSIPLSAIAAAPGAWHTYVQGVCHTLRETGYPIQGFELDTDGLQRRDNRVSAPTAFCCAIVKALDALFDLGLSPYEMSLIAQRAEYNFAQPQRKRLYDYACYFFRSDGARVIYKESSLQLVNAGPPLPGAGTATPTEIAC